MSNERTLSAEESLRLISDTISQTRETIRDKSFPFILWGWAIALASFLNYFLMVHTTVSQPDIVWLLFPLGAGIILFAWLRKKKQQTATETYISYFFGRLWAILGIGFFLSIFLSLGQGMPPFAFTMMVAGIGTTVSGLVLKFRPLVWGGILFFLSAVTCIYLQIEHQILLHGAAMLVGYLAPAYLMKNAKV